MLTSSLRLCGVAILMKTVGGGWQNFLFTGLKPKLFSNALVASKGYRGSIWEKSGQ